MEDIEFQDVRGAARQVADACVTQFLLAYGDRIETLGMDEQLGFGDRVREWRQRLEDKLCAHFDNHDELAPGHVKELLAKVGPP